MGAAILTAAWSRSYRLSRVMDQQMEEASAKHSHHVVPQFYLRRFADDQKMVREWDVGTQQRSEVPVKHATVIRDLYTTDHKNGGELDAFENILGMIESNAARVMREILDEGHWPLTDRPRQRLSLWIAAQYLRTPRFRDYMESQMNQVRSSLDGSSIELWRIALRDLGWTDKEVDTRWAETLQYYASEGRQPRNVHVGWFKGLVFDASRDLFHRPWSLLRFDEPALITSDSLVVPIREDVREPGIHLLSARLVHVALDRFTLLQILPAKGALQPGDDPHLRGSQELATMSNIMAIEHADRHGYEHPADLILERLASRLLRAPTSWDV